MHPGECASTHRHSASALRFIMEGSGAYTIVDGHKMTLGANDFVLTPNGTWHEHGVDADGTPCIWQDGLDIPLVNALEANFYEVHPDLHQAGHATRSTTSTATWAAPALLPHAARLEQALFAAAQVRMGADLRGAARYATVTDGSPYDGVLMHYVNPRDRRPGDADDRRQHAAAAPGRAHARRTATPAASSTRSPRARAIRSSTASASTGRSATSSACRPGRGTSTPTRRRPRTPACSASTTCR